MTEYKPMLPQMLRGLAETDPDGLALVDIDQDVHLTHRELHERNLKWASVLREAGVLEHDFVATMVPNSFEAYNLWLGTAWLRAVEVPLNTSYRGYLLRHALNSSMAREAVIATEFLPNLIEIADSLPNLRTVILPDTDEVPDLPWNTIAAKSLLRDAAPAEGLVGPERWDTQAVIFTSGTSGPSKPVLAPWGTLPVGIDAPGLGDMIDRGGALFGSFPAFHQSGKASLLIAINAGGNLVMRRQFSPTRFLDDVRTHNVTGTLLIGAMTQFLLNQPERDDDADTPLERACVMPIPPNVEEFKRRFGLVVSTLYGSTEFSRVLVSPGFNVSPPGSCGRLVEDRYGFQARIVDEHDQELPAGATGELIVRIGEPWTMMKGYLGMPEETVQCMRNGWFHTGDALRKDEDGNFFFVDRIKDAIRRRGENISSFEVEEYVNEHPEIEESAAVGLRSEETHHEDELKVCVVLKAGSNLTPEDLHRYLADRMPKFMVPRYLEIVASFPRTPTQKVQKALLRAAGITDHTWDNVLRAVVPARHTGLEENEPMDDMIRTPATV